MLRRVLVVVLLAQLALVVPARAGGGGCSKPVTDKRAAVVTVKQWCFTPTITHVRKGARVTWVNRDLDQHNVAGANILWGSSGLKRGDSVSFRFMEKGTYPYICQFHPGMIGAVVVGNGKATTSFSWRDEVVTKVRYERNDSSPPASPSDGKGGGGSSSGSQADLASVPASDNETSLPVEWFVVLAAAVAVLVFAVLLGMRRRSQPLTR